MGFSARSRASDVQAEEDPSVRGKIGFDLEESVWCRSRSKSAYSRIQVPKRNRSSSYQRPGAKLRQR